MKDIVKRNPDQQILKIKKEMVADPTQLTKDGYVKSVEKDAYYEKVFELIYWDGIENRTVIIRNLNNEINGRRLEDIITESLLNPSGMVLITEKDEDGSDMRLFIKAKSIISCKQVWKKI